MCKLKKLSNDKRSPKGGVEEDEPDVAEGEAEEKEENEGPAWAEDGLAGPRAVPAGRARGTKHTPSRTAPSLSGSSKVPVSRPKLNPNVAKRNQSSGKFHGKPDAGPLDLGNPGPNDVADVPLKKKTEPGIVRTAKKVCPCSFYGIVNVH